MEIMAVHQGSRQALTNRIDTLRFCVVCYQLGFLRCHCTLIPELGNRYVQPVLLSLTCCPAKSKSLVLLGLFKYMAVAQPSSYQMMGWAIWQYSGSTTVYMDIVNLVSLVFRNFVNNQGTLWISRWAHRF
jgi:hypothetical protein